MSRFWHNGDDYEYNMYMGMAFRRLSIMANGTIAFDTLTTSDSVNTGTEKSIDTSYFFNGVAKVLDIT